MTADTIFSTLSCIYIFQSKKATTIIPDEKLE